MILQLSLTTRCTANCKFCLRTTLKKYYNFYETIDMDIEIAKKIMDYPFDRIIVCANRGEALLHPNIDEILQYGKDQGRGIDFITNGFYKSESWWRNLAKNVFTPRDTVSFPLDGIGNEIHQKHRGTDFYIVLRNMEAFKNSGGNAFWKFIRFKHNQHQIQIAKDLARELGFPIYFMNSHTYTDGLEEPTDNEAKVWTSENIMEEKYSEDEFLHCKSNVRYASCKGILFPCCFIANVFSNRPYREKHPEKELVELYETEKHLLDLRTNEIEDIGKTKFFKECFEHKTFLCQKDCLKYARNII